jgi:hypothetical protein
MNIYVKQLLKVVLTFALNLLSHGEESENPVR